MSRKALRRVRLPSGASNTSGWPRRGTVRRVALDRDRGACQRGRPRCPLLPVPAAALFCLKSRPHHGHPGSRMRNVATASALLPAGHLVLDGLWPSRQWCYRVFRPDGAGPLPRRLPVWLQWLRARRGPRPTSPRPSVSGPGLHVLSRLVGRRGVQNCTRGRSPRGPAAKDLVAAWSGCGRSPRLQGRSARWVVVLWGAVLVSLAITREQLESRARGFYPSATRCGPGPSHPRSSCARWRRCGSPTSRVRPRAKSGSVSVQSVTYPGRLATHSTPRFTLRDPRRSGWWATTLTCGRRGIEAQRFLCVLVVGPRPPP